MKPEDYKKLQEKLKKESQDTRDSIRGKDNYQAGIQEVAYWPNPNPNDLPDTKPDWRDE